MAKYTITENSIKSLLDWKRIIKQSDCETKPRSGTFAGNEGHEDCNDNCPGNYWNGGNCNYETSDLHTLTNDLTAIERNFNLIELITTNHEELRDKSDNEEEFKSHQQDLMTNIGQARDACRQPGSFFKNTCFAEHDQPLVLTKGAEKRFAALAKGLEKYLELVEKATYQELVEFRERLNKLDDLQKNQKNLKGSKLKSSKELSFQICQEMEISPVAILFDFNTHKILVQSKQELLEPTIAGDNYWAKLGNLDKIESWYSNQQEINKEQNNEEVPKSGSWPWGKISLYGGGGLVAVIGLVWIYKWTRKGS